MEGLYRSLDSGSYSATFCWGKYLEFGGLRGLDVADKFFPLVVQQVTTDKYSANLKAEEFLNKELARTLRMCQLRTTRAMCTRQR